jgi:subtilisin family serine protease
MVLGSRGRRTRRALAGFATLVALAGLTLAGATGGTAATDSKLYIVQMLQSPAVAYTGGISGLAATKPAKGQKIDPNSADVKKYTDYLKGEHDKSLAKVGGSNKIYDYTISFNGYSASLTESQVAALQKQADVLAVSENQEFAIDTSNTPSFLGLDATGGLWSQLGGVGANKKSSGAGEDIVIGIIDSGIWPESKSFSDRNAAGESLYSMPGTNRWRGRKCTPGEAFDAELCNRKLIGGQYFNAAWGGNAALEAARPWEFMSVRDYNGHGTHTASTAGGNYGVQGTGPSAAFAPMSGMAPRARIAAYKALWSTQDASTAGGQTADLVAAIDQAVADGVDVINYSISGTLTNFLDPVEIAYLFAADAGVFVAASAGNSGPATSTVAHPSPWLTTVAAGTHNRNGTGSVTLGNGATISGASIASAVGPAPFIDSINAGAAGADPAEVALCFAASDNAGVPVLDPAKVAGKIVLCDRGVNARVNKSLAVKQAGGVGMVMVNTSLNSLNADFHFVPSVHASHLDRPALKAYAATANPTATINAGTITFTDPAPFTASFSSRGPLQAGGGDLLKPDVIAPGQDILAAVAPPGQQGLDFNILSGTSMSSPHVAGLAALFKQKYPSWSPMMIKSALMTSGADVLDGGTPPAAENIPALIFRQGAGHVRPNVAANPGLVYNSSFNDWLAFLCGTTTGVNPASCATLKSMGYSTDPSDLNSASIAIGDIAGVQTVTRKVTNVGAESATYTASVTGMSGITTTVTPSSFTIAPGATQTFTVSFLRTTAALNTYTGGQLRWTSGSTVVRSPIVVLPVALAVPAQVNGTGTEGSLKYNIKAGYTGALAFNKRGLIPSEVFSDTVADDPTDNFNTANPTGNQGIKTHDVVVPAGTSALRVSMFDEDTDGQDDIDLYLYRVGAGGSLTIVGSSGGGTSAEQIHLTNPTAATYRVFVHGWGTDGPDAVYKLHAWVLGTTDAGNMTVVGPASAVTGQVSEVTLSWSGLLGGKRYLGAIRYDEGATNHATTIVRVDTP